MKKKYEVPAFVSIVAMFIGAYDLIRGVMHVFLLQYSAINIAGLNLTTPQAPDLLRLLGAFGVSNFLTGIMLMLMAWRARPLALLMLGIIPAIYAVGRCVVLFYLKPYPVSTANWGGLPMLMVYLAICTITFILGVYFTKCTRV